MLGKLEALTHFPGSTSRPTWVYQEREFKWTEPRAQVVLPRILFLTFIYAFEIMYFLIPKVI